MTSPGWVYLPLIGMIAISRSVPGLCLSKYTISIIDFVLLTRLYLIEALFLKGLEPTSFRSFMLKIAN